MQASNATARNPWGSEVPECEASLMHDVNVYGLQGGVPDAVFVHCGTAPAERHTLLRVPGETGETLWQRCITVVRGMRDRHPRDRGHAIYIFVEYGVPAHPLSHYQALNFKFNAMRRLHSELNEAKTGDERIDVLDRMLELSTARVVPVRG